MTGRRMVAKAIASITRNGTTPVSDGKQLALRVPSEPLSELDALFAQQGIEEWKITSKGGQKTISGRTKGGGAVRLSIYTSNGFRERTSSTSDGLSPARRRTEAKRLRKSGLTQSEIAERLGCSQKTISNDLRA